MGCTSSQTTAAWVPFTCYNPSGTDLPNTDPPWGDRSGSKTAPVWAPLFMDPQVQLEPTPAQVLHVVTGFSGCGVLHKLQWNSLSHHGLHLRLREGISALAPELSPSLRPWYKKTLCHLIFTLLASAVQDFFPHKMLSQRYYHHCWWVWPWPVVDPSWSQLATALSDTGEDPRYPCGPYLLTKPCYTNLREKA